MAMQNFIMLVGAPGSGKTTYAKARYQEHEVVSSDHIRYLICGDEGKQIPPDEVFLVARTLVRAKLVSGVENVILDATNVVPKNRQSFVRFVRSFVSENTLIKAKVFHVPLETLLKQNLQRSRVVPDSVVRKMYNSLESFPVKLEEGFDEVEYVYTSLVR